MVSVNQLFAGLYAVISLCLAQADTGAPTQRVVHQYSNGTWIENLAIRKDGTILATQATAPHLYAVNPFTGKSTLVKSFPKVTGLVGITETTPDVFFLVAGNASLATFTGTVGTFSIWKVDYSKANPSPRISKEVDLPNAKFIDGLLAVGQDKQILLGADLNRGQIIQIDLKTKKVSTVSNDPLLKPVNNLGVDGIKIWKNELYFTNSGKMIFGKIPIDKRGTPTGPATAFQSGGGDDFTFDVAGNIFGAGENNHTIKISGPQLGRTQNLTVVNGATAAQFGRTAKDGGCLYVTSCGGYAAYAQAPVPVAGAIYSVDVFQNGSCPTMP